ncbi:sporulation protein YqfD [Thalassobacillus hwangdonensis]|uniref:Sporulation protein YqfD n=1 Tax=Thalassobacillus hwangdonensis TaxID=546108 RepID=A0ABW3L110_9BACI
MKQLQGRFLKGTVTMIVEGEYPEFFLNRCSINGIKIWNLKRISDTKVEATIFLTDLKQIKALRKGFSYKVRLKSGQGIPFLFGRFKSKKPLWFALFLTIGFLIFLSNVVWSVHINGLPEDLERKVEKSLSDHGVVPGAFSFKLDDPPTIQQKLLDDVPELLWIGVEKKGTAYVLHGVEKTLVDKEKDETPSNLIAGKKGLITRIYISQGRPMVTVNDYVKKGEILASAQLDENDETLVRAEGEVIAETWYKVEVTTPKVETIYTATGESENKYRMRVFNVELPVWGWGKIDYRLVNKDEETSQWKLFKKELPIFWEKATYYELNASKHERTKKETLDVAKEQARMELLKKLPKDSVIVDENLLHEGEENGKVKLILFFKVNEDIAVNKNVPQGV